MMPRYNGETDEQVAARAEIRSALEALFAACKRSGAVVAGFVFGADPALFIRFQTCSDEGAELAELFAKLCGMAEQKEAAGLYTRDDITARRGKEPVN